MVCYNLPGQEHPKCLDSLNYRGEYQANALVNLLQQLCDISNMCKKWLAISKVRKYDIVEQSSKATMSNPKDSKRLWPGKCQCTLLKTWEEYFACPGMRGQQ